MYLVTRSAGWEGCYEQQQPIASISIVKDCQRHDPIFTCAFSERREVELGFGFFFFLTAEALTVEETSLDLPKNPVKQPETWDAGTSMLPPAMP